MTTITSSPWGKPDHVEALCFGVYRVSTPSHGGFYVEPAQCSRIPIEQRRASFNGQGMQGWFEEDCDWCMVALAFPTLFPAAVIEQAQKTFAYWIKPKM